MWIALIPAVVLALALAARRLLVVVTVDGPSMEPTLRSGSRLLVLRVRRLRPGRIVVLRNAAGQALLGDRLIVKRVAAVAGEQIPDSVLPVLGGRPGDLVPPGRLVVLGDSPALSADSRHWGFAAANDVVGVLAGRLS
jgi:signal peptidase I